MSVSNYNANQYRDFPFKYRDRQYNATDLPRSWIVDAGITLPEEAAGYMPTEWYLFKISRTSTHVTVTFAWAYNPNYAPQIKVTYPIAQPEFTTIVKWQGFVGEDWLRPDRGSPINSALLADPRWPAQYEVLTAAEFPQLTNIRTSAQIYVAFGDPEAILPMLAAGNVTFAPSVWPLEPCQVTDLQSLNATQFIQHNRSDEDAGIPTENWGTGVTPTIWQGIGVDISATKNTDGFLGNSVASSDANPAIPQPSYTYKAGKDVHWATEIVRWPSDIPTPHSTYIETLSYVGIGIGTIGCEAVASRIDNSVILNGGRFKPGSICNNAGREYYSNYRVLTAARTLQDFTRTILPGIPCNNLIYTINGLTGPDIPVTVGPGLIKSSDGDGHLKISVDLNHPKIRAAIGL